MSVTQNPYKKIIQRGKYIILPIIGDSVSELCLRASHAPTIVFRDLLGDESQLTCGEVLLTRGEVETRLNPFHKSGGFDPRQLHPLLDLLGACVSDAWAQHDGSLELSFSNDVRFRAVLPEGGYEGWHFQYPRVGRPVGGDLKNYLCLFGFEGKLVR